MIEQRDNTKLDKAKLQEVVEKIAYQQTAEDQADDLFNKMGILNDYVAEQLILPGVVKCKMTSKEEAEKLIEQHEDIYQYRALAIEHAILTANIMLEQLHRVGFYRMDEAEIMIGHWSKVKKELNRINNEH